MFLIWSPPGSDLEGTSGRRLMENATEIVSAMETIFLEAVSEKDQSAVK